MTEFFTKCELNLKYVDSNFRPNIEIYFHTKYDEKRTEGFRSVEINDEELILFILSSFWRFATFEKLRKAPYEFGKIRIDSRF